MFRRFLVAVVLGMINVLAAAYFGNAMAYTFSQVNVPFRGASDTSIFGINDLGEIVGSYRDSGFQLHGFLRDAGGNFVSVDAPFPNANNTTAYGVNNQGEIVGSYNVGAFQNLHGFISVQGQFRAIDAPFAGASNTEVFGVNGQGDIVGGYFRAGAEHGFHSGNEFTSLDYPSGAVTEAQGINKTAVIVGSYLDADFNQHGFILNDEAFHAIDVPSASNGTIAFGVNDLGQVVGDYFTDDFARGVHGFLLDNGLFSSIDVPFAGSFNTVIRGINNQGDLVGLYSDGQGLHGFIASPQAAVPEPSSLLLLGFGLAVLAGLSALCEAQHARYFLGRPALPQAFDRSIAATSSGVYITSLRGNSPRKKLHPFFHSLALLFSEGVHFLLSPGSSFYLSLDIGYLAEVQELYRDAIELGRHSGGPKQKMLDGRAFLWRSEPPIAANRSSPHPSPHCMGCGIGL